MSRRPFIAGNWKLNLGPGAAASVAKFIAEMNSGNHDVDVTVFPTALSIPSVVAALQGSGVEVGIQDIHTKTEGAYTGCNSSTFARESGCTRALIGHSERRTLFSEADEVVNEKIRTVMTAGLLPIVCIGESKSDREAERHHAVISKQLTGALRDINADQVASIVLAYEPVWAIGTGLTATPDTAQSMHKYIRNWLYESYPRYVGDAVRIQYGGSVNISNAKSLLSCPDIDGALVGGASLNPSDFTDIIRQA